MRSKLFRKVRLVIFYIFVLLHNYLHLFISIHCSLRNPINSILNLSSISNVEKVGDPKLMENLEQEISIMRDYLHPNIVQLFEHFSSSRYIYLVLEICPGGDLSKFIKKCQRVEERVAQGFLRQLSDGLHFLQQKNVIHRDLKPANILLSEFSTQAVLKIADFGFAKHLVEASMAQTPCGSPL
jgi:serine/threonine-protein kinase ULK/ATG1